MSEVENKEVKAPVEPAVEGERTIGHEGGEGQKDQEKKPFRKLDSRWEIIDKIKESDEQAVVINIFKVHQDVTWKEIKEVYKDFQMKIEKVQSKEGMFNLHFRNHNDAINFVKISPLPILDKKFLMRLNNRIKKEDASGWNEIGTDGHTTKFETKKYYQNKAKHYKKNFKKEGEEGEEVKENQEEGTNLPTKEEGTDLPTKQEDATKRAPAEKGPRRFIGEADSKPHHHHNAGSNKPKATEAPKQEVEAPKLPTAESWSTVKDPVAEKKQVQATQKLQKEKEAQQKKEQEAKNAAATKVVSKKPITDFSDGWN